MHFVLQSTHPIKMKKVFLAGENSFNTKHVENTYFSVVQL